LVFEEGGKQLYAIVTEPVDVPLADFTVILFNAGGHRRIGPNRMWTDAARRWATLGVPAIRVDLEGLGDAEGDPVRYRDVNLFYESALVLQAKAVLELAVSIGLPGRFLTGGICSGGFWAFQVALDDPRIVDVVAINPRQLVFDPHVKGRRVVQRLGRLFGRDGLKRLIHAERKSKQLQDMLAFVLTTPLRAMRPSPATGPNLLESQLTALRERGQRFHVAFSEDEPLERELNPAIFSTLPSSPVSRKLPCASHTLKPLLAQHAAHAMLDSIVKQAMNKNAPHLASRKRRRNVGQGAGRRQSQAKLAAAPARPTGLR
jgi:hypothetical protein